MRSVVVAVTSALLLSIGVLAQGNLPKSMQDAKPANIDFKNATAPDILRFIGKVVDVEIRFTPDVQPKVLDVHFTNARPADIFAFVAIAAGLNYAAVDEKTIVVTSK
jgi:hypothetical protein